MQKMKEMQKMQKMKKMKAMQKMQKMKEMQGYSLKIMISTIIISAHYHIITLSH